MNAGVFFQTMNSSPTVKAGSTQLANASNNSKDSFKQEMDKVFDRKQNDANSTVKSPIPEKSNDSSRVQQKTDSKKYPKDDADSGKDDQNVNAEQAGQILAAAQLQQPVVPTVNVGNSIGDMLQQIQNPAITEVLVKPDIVESPLNLNESIKPDEGAKNGDIKLPFQNSIDLVKSSMIQSNQNDTQDNQMSGFGENLTKENPILGQDVKEADTTQSEPTVSQEVKPVKDDATVEITDKPEGNIFLKNSNLDLSKVNIKVAEAPVDTNQADMAQQLADKIMYKLSAGKQEFDLQLNPRELGKVNIKMIFQNGSAELVMTASNPKAHQLLSMQADTLRGILENNTGMNSTIHLKQAETASGQFDRDNFQQQSNEKQNQQNQKQEKKTTEGISFVDRLRLGLVDNLDEAV
ncbi:flagellar hook-length control protein FliK [Aminipila terrae]|uniref:Flagellar hook-length control protein-like C-terminal domain-containing protein n=1 Tax=Aminipila terrae TaxID=2697030 RepID=A0A6P1MFM3_9FIRM|nr:flagellar hook-length control protein FliK [Aminipila terrae]QHI71973.1 hypothetical protein Ami3637_05815 [Aminipila terrae]